MHPLNNPRVISLGTTRAAVPVTRKGKTFAVDGPVTVARADTNWAELPAAFKVVGKDGQEIPASGKFLITVNSIDPFHLITDYNENSLRS